MKNLLIFVLFALVGLGASNLNADPADAITVSFTIEKMTCATCPIAVKKAMQRIDGVENVEVDYDLKTATVTFDASVTSSDEIGTASTNVGFPARLQKTDDE